MKVFIDADGCPVVDITINICKQNNIECTLISDTSHIFNKDGVTIITVDKSADSADFKIVNMINKGDIIVTQDYGLAAMCLARKGIPINQNGLVYTDYNIDSLLETRYTAKKIRNAGGRTKGPSKRTKIQDEDFKLSFSKLIEDKQ